MISGSNSPDLSPLDYQVLRAMLECYHKLQQKQFPSLKNALQMIWSALPEKAINNSVKDYHKWLLSAV